MKLPIVLDESGDVSLYWSIDEAVMDLEAIDVRNGEYVGWDATGQKIEIRLQGDLVVGIGLSPERNTDTEGLVVALRRYVAARGSFPDVAQLSLSQLLGLVKAEGLRN